MVEVEIVVVAVQVLTVDVRVDVTGSTMRVLETSVVTVEDVDGTVTVTVSVEIEVVASPGMVTVDVLATALMQAHAEEYWARLAQPLAMGKGAGVVQGRRLLTLVGVGARASRVGPVTTAVDVAVTVPVYAVVVSSTSVYDVDVDSYVDVVVLTSTITVVYDSVTVTVAKSCSPGMVLGAESAFSALVTNWEIDMDGMHLHCSHSRCAKHGRTSLILASRVPQRPGNLVETQIHAAQRVDGVERHNR